MSLEGYSSKRGRCKLQTTVAPPLFSSSHPVDGCCSTQQMPGGAESLKKKKHQDNSIKMTELSNNSNLMAKKNIIRCNKNL